jgi:hypothetical protein
MISKEEYKRRTLVKKISIFLLFFAVIVLITFFIWKSFLKSENIEKKQKIEKVYFQLPYIYDPKAVLKAKYLNLSNYTSYQLIECIVNNKCANTNLLITAYLYKNANKSFCDSLENNLTVNERKFYIENLEDVKKVCKVFYLMKEHKLEKKDCIDPIVSTICATYFEYEKTDFIKSNIEIYNLINNLNKEQPKITSSYCLKLENPASYFCFKNFNLSCSNLESEKEIKKCFEILAIPDKNYNKFLNIINETLEKKNWSKIIKFIEEYSNNTKYLHTLARLGTLNGSICSYFENYSIEQERYCLKKYFNHRFLCEYSPDKRECYFFDVILNNKSCNELKDPILITDCELFKKYYGKVNCSFFYNVGSNEYLGYLCAIKSGNCEGNNYYDKMYKIICEYLVKERK